jgi:hypothetical protein
MVGPLVTVVRGGAFLFRAFAVERQRPDRRHDLRLENTLLRCRK